MKSEHIRVSTEGGAVSLVVDDWELCDFLDDHLTDLGFEFHLTIEGQGELQTYVLRLSADTTLSAIEQALARVPDDEIRQIWEINKGRK
ncbi:MAG: hypothetical protein H6718_06530 [Polyangiaceae bacterium]|nr:hypothetical protein [Myxococcales bacterium]MCB9585035.1 hypothetical protein [Polyangiaceae bacterium]MCB9610074.1 hypothetical protein [Polyangiaceae bacterium]